MLISKKRKFIDRFIICFALVLCFFGGWFFASLESGGAVFSVINRQNKKFVTPEDAIEYFVQKISENDYAGLINASAKMGDYDFVAFSKKIGSVLPSWAWPGEYEMYKSMNEIYYAGELEQQIKGVIWSLLEPDFDYSSPILLSFQGISATKINNDLNPSRLSTLEVVRIEGDYIRESIRQKKESEDKKTAEIYNVDGIKEYVVLYKWNGKYYIGGYSLLKVNGGWKIYSLSAPLFGIDSRGILIETTEEDFDKRIAEMKEG